MKPMTPAMLAAMRAIAATGRRPNSVGKRTLQALVRRGLVVWGRDWCSVTAAGLRVLAEHGGAVLPAAAECEGTVTT